MPERACRMPRIPEHLEKVDKCDLLLFFNPNSQKWANDAPGLTSFASKATSGKFSDYRAEHEATVARKAFLEAQLEANQAAACLSESKAECDCDHQAITQG